MVLQVNKQMHTVSNNQAPHAVFYASPLRHNLCDPFTKTKESAQVASGSCDGGWRAKRRLGERDKKKYSFSCACEMCSRYACKTERAAAMHSLSSPLPVPGGARERGAIIHGSISLVQQLQHTVGFFWKSSSPGRWEIYPIWNVLPPPGPGTSSSDHRQWGQGRGVVYGFEGRGSIIVCSIICGFTKWIGT